MTPLVLLLACKAGPPDSVPLDISLEDVNPNSVTYGDQVTLGQVGDAATAWYFTHAT
ncbi:MAG: hypothetical protein H6742_11725 [Alphaproteobacteria bacterium]|nr:hypothetical protein [Alphaproteobacteria bacterium]